AAMLGCRLAHVSSLMLLFTACAAGAPVKQGPSSSGGSGGSGSSSSSSGAGVLLDPGDAGAPPPDASVCGDNVCGPAETCRTCPTDCGQCPACNAAPSCSEALALPSQPRVLSFGELSAPIGAADAGVPDAGFPAAGDCGGAQLRLRISRLEVGHQGQEV